jgi:type IV pilus assembly protein PilQ
MSSNKTGLRVHGRPKWAEYLRVLLILLLGVYSWRVEAALSLQSLNFSVLPGDRLEFVLMLNGPAIPPRHFQTENPDRIILDLPGVSCDLAQRSVVVGRSGVERLQAVSAGGRTRIILELSRMQPYTTRIDGNRIVLTLQPGVHTHLPSQSTARPTSGSVAADARPYSPIAGVKELGNVDFRRGERGEGRLLVTLGNPKAVVDIKREGRKVIIRLPDAELPSRLARRLDVIDFATPIHYIEASADGSGVKITVIPVSDHYEFASYQSGSLLAVDFRALPERERTASGKRPTVYTGNKLTLNFQDISVRSVLQILGDFTSVNIVASDTVEGNVTLRLQDVPWDQALDLVLKAKGLGKRQEGNIIRVAPLDELNKQERDELEAQRVVEDLEPLRTEIIQINYTKAEDLKKILVGTTEKTNQSTSETSPITGQRSTTATTALDVTQSVLSPRGNVTTDPRTNQLIVQETALNIDRIRELVSKLDKPVRQVLIESRIVIATNDFTRELGARLSLNRATSVNTQSKGNTNYDIVPPNDASGVSGNALVDLASTAATASGGYFGVTFLKVGEYLLDLELSAAQIDGRSEIVSTPKLVTTDQTEAYILQGQQLPYTQNNALGASNTQFKDAVLELKVTPHITPDENILMDLSVKKDARGEQTQSGLAIDKREIRTTAQVANGETMVLGGVFEGDQQNQTDKVPFLGDLPGVGFMFRRDLVKDNKKELLIFITPKVIGSALVGR